MTDYADVPVDLLEKLRAICLGLPEAHEEEAWAGKRWCIRKRTFVHAVLVDTPGGSATVLNFRAAEPELEVLRRTGHPFFTPGWGTNTVGMILNDATDWDEVAELLVESYCILAPKKLAALVDRPPA